MMSPNLMLEKVALTDVAVVDTPVVQVPALPPSSHDIPLADGSSHKLTASTMPVVKALVKGVMPPAFAHPVAPVAVQNAEVMELPPAEEAEF